MQLDKFTVHDGKKLRYGYTTGSTSTGACNVSLPSPAAAFNNVDKVGRIYVIIDSTRYIGEIDSREQLSCQNKSDAKSI